MIFSVSAIVFTALVSFAVLVNDKSIYSNQVSVQSYQMIVANVDLSRRHVFLGKTMQVAMMKAMSKNDLILEHFAQDSNYKYDLQLYYCSFDPITGKSPEISLYFDVTIWRDTKQIDIAAHSRKDKKKNLTTGRTDTRTTNADGYSNDDERIIATMTQCITSFGDPKSSTCDRIVNVK